MPRLSQNFRQYKRKTYLKNGVYHVYNRGVAKQDIFLEDKDYTFYLSQLKKWLELYDFELYYFCLMPNHVHLCLGQRSEFSTIDLVHRLHTIYAIYFNQKYERVGSLFQGRFKQSIIDSDAAFLHVGKYIHLNPVSGGICSQPEDYIWSSAGEYVLGKQGLCRKSRLAEYYADAISYRTYLLEQENSVSMQEYLLSERVNHAGLSRPALI